MQSVMQQLRAKEAPIGIVGLGYVGLPLACLFAEKYRVVGLDINTQRVKELSEGVDLTREVQDKEKLLNKNLSYTTDPKSLSDCPVIVVAVPTPVDRFKKPDLTPLISASTSVGKVMKRGTTVVFESTVYPGLTEDVCRKKLEEASGLTFGKDFFLGYSPERVNPGDKLHTIERIVKVVAGSNAQVTDTLCELYSSVITAGIHRAPNIATAEAAKVIENTQRDINIALINELATLFDRVGLDTQEVLAAARTKWNFLDFKPGLVGGHCIGVDPYYLTYLAEGIGLHPQLISSGRRINDDMAQFVAKKTLSLILGDSEAPSNPVNVGILGVTFKENVPDIRNTRVVDIVASLEEFGAKVHLFDPVVHAAEFEEEYHRQLTSWHALPKCDALILAVQHEVFTKEYPLERLIEKLGPIKVVVDVKGVLSREKAKELGVTLWRL